MSLGTNLSLKSRKSRAILSSCLIGILVPIALIGAINLGFFSVASSPSANVSFSTPVNLSADTYQAQYPWVSSSGSNVYVAWTEEAHGIYYRYSNNYGESWNPPLTSAATRLSEKGGTTSYPVMAANGSNVYVVWTQSLTSGGDGEVFVASSNNYGVSFSTSELSVNLTTYSSDIPYAAAYGNDIYIIWHAVATSNAAQSIWVSSSSNAGATWRTAVELDAKTGQGDEPQIAAWGTYAYATWDRNGPYFSYTSNNGQSWSTPVNLNPGTKAVPAGTTREPWITAAGSNVYVTWNDNSGYGTTVTPAPYDPYIMISTNNGQTWNQNANVPVKGVKWNLMPTSTSSWEIQDQAVGNSVYVFWRDHTPAYTTNGDILLMTSSNAGLTWTPSLGSPLDVSNDNQITGWSNGIGVSGNTVALAYMSDCVTGLQEPSPNSGSGDCGMMVAYSNNGGQSFFPEVNVSNDRTAGPITDVSSSNFAVSGSYVFVTWQDQAASNFQVYFSVTNGAVVQAPTFSATPVRGSVGTVVNVTGGNFKANSQITVSFGSTIVGTTTSNGGGNFSTTIAIPAAAQGSYQISATDGTTTQTSNFNLVPNIALTPVRGQAGSSVSVSGNGFAASSSVSVTFGSSGQMTTANTDSVGNFTASFTVPSIGAGSNTVTATDASSNSATANFNVLAPKITLSPAKGATGKVITVTGTGFSPSATVAVSYDSVNQTTTTSNSTGGFTTTFTAPPSPAGSNTVGATDGTNSATANYNVVSSISITPKTSAGKNDITVTVTGTGFINDTTITITFGGTAIVTSPATITSTDNGDFSATFVVSTTTTAGSYTVEATDGTNSATAKFTMN